MIHTLPTTGSNREAVGQFSTPAFLAQSTATTHTWLLLNGKVYHSKAYKGTTSSVSYSVAFWHCIPDSPIPVKYYGTMQYYISLTGPDFSREEDSSQSEKEHSLGKVTFVWAYVRCHKPLQSPPVLYGYPVASQGGET